MGVQVYRGSCLIVSRSLSFDHVLLLLSGSTLYIVHILPVLRSRWSRIYLRPGAGAGAKIIFAVNIYLS